MNKEFKIKIKNESHRIAVYGRAVELGYDWKGDDPKDDYDYMYGHRDGSLTLGFRDEIFTNHPHNEVTIDDLYGDYRKPFLASIKVVDDAPYHVESVNDGYIRIGCSIFKDEDVFKLMGDYMEYRNSKGFKSW